MESANGKLLYWSSEHVSGFATRALVARHRLHELPLFSDAALMEVLQSHPRDRLQAFTMGTDVSKVHEWQPVDVSGLSGIDMLTAIERGRFWFHLFRMQNASAQYKELLDRLFS